MNALNREFQSEQFRLHQLHAMITMEYKSILPCFIKEKVLHSKKLSKIGNQKSISDVHLGGNALAHLITNPFQNKSCSNRFKLLQVSCRTVYPEEEKIAYG